jgi:hypothetical protein
LVKNETLTVELETVSSTSLTNAVAVGEAQQVEVAVSVVAVKS